ncbi:MAG TPA: histidine phosphatase family protein [Chitinophagaceae bacterium]|nr:histidine phosphatase family protein [Chitinophagaceae bacterium]
MKLLIYTLLFLFTGFTSSCQNSNEIYIVRHAEKGTEPANNPPLTNEGKQRAETLKQLLKDKNIQAIYSTPTARTTETAKPLSDAINVPIQFYTNDTMAVFLQKVIDRKKNVLIVAHSNTILPMLDALHLAHNTTNIPDNVYTNVFIIKAKGNKTAIVTETTYDAMSPVVK